MEEMEYKATPAEFKATGDQGEYEGHFSVFGNVDDGDDRSWPGMFRKTLQESGQRVRVFYQHMWDKLIGPRPDVLEEDSTGLYAKGHLTIASFWGREAFALMKDNALTEGSFGYQAVKFDLEEVEGRTIRNLREVRLFEISPVPLGMNALTSVRAVKAALLWGRWLEGKPVEETDDYIRVRVRLPGEFEPGSFRTIDISKPKKIKAVIGRLKGKETTAVQVYLFDKEGWTEEEAVQWVKDHGEEPKSDGVPLEIHLDALTMIATELKEGRVLSGASKEKVNAALEAMKNAIGALEELLAAAEPPQKHSALLRLNSRLRAAEIALALPYHS